jgi:glycogen operon protein
MILGGDEFGRTQRGNNNAYCQDNPISWVSWESVGEDARQLIDFVRRLLALRARHPALRRPRFLHGRDRSSRALKDILWLSPSGAEKRADEWQDTELRCIGMLLEGAAGAYSDPLGRPQPDAALLLLLNAHGEARPFMLPGVAGSPGWRCAVDTARPLSGDCELARAAQPYDLLGRSLALLVSAEGAEG